MGYKQYIDFVLSYGEQEEKLSEIKKKLEEKINNNNSEIDSFFKKITIILQDKCLFDRVFFIVGRFPNAFRLDSVSRKVFMQATVITQEFSDDNYGIIAVDCWKKICQFSYSQADNFDAAKDFIKAYNTLVRIVEEKEKLTTESDDLREKCEELENNLKKDKVKFNDACKALKENKNRRVHQCGSFLLGKTTISLSEQDKKILHKYGIGLAENEISEQIVLDINHGSVFIDTEKDNNSYSNIDRFIKNIYYNNALSFRQLEFKLAFIEKEDYSLGTPLDSFCLKLLEKEKNPLYDGWFDARIYATCFNDAMHYCSKNKEEVEKLIEDLSEELAERNKRYGQLNIVKYNEENKLATMPYILLIIHGFSKDVYFNNKTMEKLKNIISYGARFGIYTLFVGAPEKITYSDGFYSGQNNTFSMDELITSHIMLKDMVWEEAKDEEKIEKEMAKLLKDSNSLSLEKLFEIVDEKGFEKPTIGLEIAIPFGLSEGKPYYFASATVPAKSKYFAEPHSIIYGGTGTGKTSLVKTLILSGSHYYSPDELQFYVLDFKAETNNPDYNEFIQNDKNDNCYIPHVHFISIKGDKSFANDVLAMMDHIVAERNKKGCFKYDEYCEEQHHDNSMEKLPAIFFLIDEYNAIFNGANNKLVEKLIRGINSYRSAGIHIVLIGQQRTIDLGDVKNRYSFGAADYSVFNECFPSSPDIQKEARAAYRQIGGRHGQVAAYRKTGISVVQNAFCADGKSIAKEIRSKYKELVTVQQKGGSDEKVNADITLKIQEENPSALSVYSGENFSFYVGLSSMESAPIAIQFGIRERIINDEKNEEEGLPVKYKNYFLNVRGTTQKRIIENAIFAYAEHLKKNYPETQEKYISYNFWEDGVTEQSNIDLAGKTCALIQNSDMEKYIKCNTTEKTIKEEIIQLYKLYEQRKKDRKRKEIPYLATFFDFGNFFDEENFPFNGIERLEQPEAKWSIFDYPDEKIKKMIAEARNEGMTDEEIEVIVEQSINIGVLNVQKEQTPVANEEEEQKDLIDKLITILKDGQMFNIFILFGTTKSQYVKRYFINSTNVWPEIITEGNTNETCKIHDITTRLFDYECASKWWKKFNQGKRR